jgi:hypothetical protein
MCNGSRLVFHPSKVVVVTQRIQVCQNDPRCIQPELVGVRDTVHHAFPVHEDDRLPSRKDAVVVTAADVAADADAAVAAAARAE